MFYNDDDFFEPAYDNDCFDCSDCEHCELCAKLADRHEHIDKSAFCPFEHIEYVYNPNLRP